MAGIGQIVVRLRKWLGGRIPLGKCILCHMDCTRYVVYVLENPRREAHFCYQCISNLNAAAAKQEAINGK